jgi:serine/threonine-protein kinase HipA
MKIDPKLTSLAIHLHGRRVGVLMRLGGDQHLFAFEQDYIDDPNRDVLSLSFKGRAGGLVTRARPVGRRLPPFFSNLLPEGHLRAYLAEQADVKADREFFLLAALGADVAGALTVFPLEAGGREVEPDFVAEDHYAPGRRRPVLRFSLAGVQLKFSAVMEAHGGLTIPANGIGGSWIVKMPSAHFPAVPENEYAMLELARAAGIDVPEVRLVPASTIEGLPDDAARLPGNALVVRRFDRGPARERIHMEDFAQVFGLFPEDKYRHRSYANIAAVLWAETGETGVFEFLRRIVFSVLIGNGDMHLKNWSLLYPDGRQPALSPAYDFVATFPYIAGDKLALNFGGSRELDGISADQVRRFADAARLPMYPLWAIVRETVERTRAGWNTLEQKDLMPAAIRASVGRHIEATASNMAS